MMVHAYKSQHLKVRNRPWVPGHPELQNETLTRKKKKKKNTVFASGHDYNFFYLSFKDSSKGEQNLHKKAICTE